MAAPDKLELIATLDRARARITQSTDALRPELDFAAKFKRSVARHRTVLIGAAVLVGLLLARIGTSRPKKIEIGRRKGEVTKADAGKAGLFLIVLKMVFDLVRPTLLTWARGKVLARFGGAGKGKNAGAPPR